MIDQVTIKTAIGDYRDSHVETVRVQSEEATICLNLYGMIDDLCCERDEALAIIVQIMVAATAVGIVPVSMNAPLERARALLAKIEGKEKP